MPQTSPAFSRLILGVMRLREWGYDPAGLLGYIDACADLGLTSIDHADIYGDYHCEAHFGAALALRPSVRARLQLIGKCGINLLSPGYPARRVKHYDSSRAHVTASVESSLRYFNTDYLDALLIHRPDPLMDVDELAATLTDLHAAGKVKAVGVSNFTVSQIKLLQSRLDLPLVANQIEISLLHRNALTDGSLDQCQQQRMPALAWSPLAGGRMGQASGELGNTLALVGEELGGATPDQVALAWLLRHPAGIHPILGSGRLDNIQRAVAALDMAMSREQWFLLLQAAQGHQVA